MSKLSSLLSRLPTIQQARMVHLGYACWLVWAGKLSAAVTQTLVDHGGVFIVEEANQGLWFFFSEESFKALARLQIWAKLNQLSVHVELVPATLQVGYKLEKAVSVPVDMSTQEVHPSEQFEVWVHPKVKDKLLSMPGMEVRSGGGVASAGGAVWDQLQADSSLNYPADFSWYVIMKPIGAALEKNTVDGWRAFVRELEPLLEKLGAKYILNESVLIFPLDSIRQLKLYCREVQIMIREMKTAGKGYWPCVIACARRGGFNFNDDLPRKIGVDWKQLVPDFPHLSYRNAFLVGDEFKINDVRYSFDQNSIDDWCYLSLADADAVGDRGSLKIDQPKSLMAGGQKPCFYCGLKTHTPAQCPTRDILEWRPEIWERVALVGMDEMNKAFQAMEAALAADPIEGVKELAQGDSYDRLVMQGVLDVNSFSQLRMLRNVWRCRGKEMPQSLRQLASIDGETVWAALDNFRTGNLAGAEKLIAQTKIRQPRGYQANSLQGFMSLEEGDFVKAQFSWKEAERSCFNPLQQAYLIYLQARLTEYQEEYERAVPLYKQAASFAPRWLEPSYRQGVCMVKIGFTDQAMSIFQELILSEPHVFNRLLLDPEIERGRIHILGALYDLWSEAQTRMEEYSSRLEKLSKDVKMWFEDEDSFVTEFQDRIERLSKLKAIHNYVAYYKLMEGVLRLQNELSKRIETDVQGVNNRMERYYNELRDIYKEAAWFPFPKLLHEFNKDFNASAQKLKWIRVQSLQVAENFKRSQKYLTEVQDKIKVLRSRLVTLKIVRDSTLFVLLLGRNFLWLELVMLGLSLAFVPTVIYLAQRAGESYWWASAILEQKWQIQKGLALILSVVALTLAALKTAVQFEKKKAKIFEEGKLA